MRDEGANHRRAHAKLEQIGHRNPLALAAIGNLVDVTMSIEMERRHVKNTVGGRLLPRLQAKHDCQRPEGGNGFEQIEPLGKVRQWRCHGCQTIVTLD